MSEFLLVVPNDWTEIDPTFLYVQYGESQVGTLIADQEWGTFDAYITDAGLMPAGMTAVEVRSLNGRMWVKFIPVP